MTVPSPVGTARPGRPRRLLHPVAWWLWALGLAAAASNTTNPLLLLLIIAVASLVVAARRTDAPWTRSFTGFLVLGAAVVVLRAVLAALLSPVGGGTVLLRLPTVALPAIFAGIRLGGPVTTDGLAAGAVAGLQLAALLACVGAANTLAHPLRLLRTMPGALSEVGVAIIVAVTATPALLAAARRVRTGRRLRGRDGHGLRALGQTAVPVLHGALEGSLALAASMDARGYGRRAPVSAAVGRWTAAAALLGPPAVLAGLFGLLVGAGSGVLGLPLFALGVAGSVAALVLGSRRDVRTRYRPDRWGAPESLVVGCGVTALGSVLATGLTGSAGQLDPSTVPLALPPVPLLAGVGLLIAALPAVLAPPVVATVPVAARRPGRVT